MPLFYVTLPRDERAGATLAQHDREKGFRFASAGKGQYILLSPMWRREVARQRRREDCCNCFCVKAFLIRIKVNY